MKLTVRLTDEAFARYEHGIIALGTMLEVFLKSDLLLAAAYDDPAGWYEKRAGHQERALIAVGQDRYAFCGEVDSNHVEQEGLDIFYDVLVDCGLPISLLLHDPDARPGDGDLGDHTPDPGARLAGLAALSLDWGDREVLPVGQALGATVVGIDRLVLRPGPGFGQLRSESQLQRHIVAAVPFAPDQVFLTLAISV